jgi:hypothetical protein
MGGGVSYMYHSGYYIIMQFGVERRQGSEICKGTREWREKKIVLCTKRIRKFLQALMLSLCFHRQLRFYGHVNILSNGWYGDGAEIST